MYNSAFVSARPLAYELYKTWLLTVSTGAQQRSSRVLYERSGGAKNINWRVKADVESHVGHRPQTIQTGMQ